MVACCDIDCVLNDLALKWLNWINKKYGYYTQYDELINYHMIQNFPTLNIAQVNEPIHNISFLDSLEPTKGSQAALRYIDMLHELYIVTATPPMYAQQKVDWMQNHFPFINSNRLIFTSQKERIKCDIFIDDCPEHLIRSDCKTIQYIQPWNSNRNWGDLQCKNFEEILSQIGGDIYI